jgi:hypothetical protein
MLAGIPTPVMAARVAAIYVFGAGSKVVDGRAEHGHDA